MQQSSSQYTLSFNHKVCM